MAKWLAKEFDWDTGRYTGRYYDIAEAGIVAVFVDSFYGDDGSADPEDPDLPLKTLGAAITYLNTTGANGSRIFMNGIFSENLPAQTYWYDFIGCGGGWNGRTVIWHNEAGGTRIIFNKDLSKVQNLQTVNYAGLSVFNTANTAENRYVVNCFFKNCLFNRNSGSGPNTELYAYHTIFKEVVFQGGTVGRFINIRGNKNILYDCSVLSDNSMWYFYANNSHVYNSRWTEGGQGNLFNIIGQYIDPQENNFNVRLSSPLIGAGTIDEITGYKENVGGVQVGLPYNGITPEFTTEGGATITDLTIDASGKFTITSPATTGTLETALMDLGNIYPLENIDLFNVFDFLNGEITQGVFETFSSPRMALTIKLKYGLTSAEVDDCPWLLIEYGKQPTFSGTGASRVGNAADTFDPDTFQTITCRYMKLFVTLQNNS